MADLLIRIYPTDTSLKIHSKPSCSCFNTLGKRFRSNGRLSWAVPNNKESPHFVYSEKRKLLFLVPTCSVSSSTSTAKEVGNNKQSSYEESESQSVWLVEDNANYLDGKRDNEVEYLANDFGWKVRRLADNGEDIRNAFRLQAKAFHEPTFLFDDFFFHFFQAEVLAGLIYKLKNSPPDRYACLVAKAETSDISNLEQELLVGVVDVTALRDQNVLHNLPPDADEYLYISGIAVSEKFRRKKIATVLLKACDMLSILWGFKYLVLRAYENDHGAQELYSNAGYRVVSGDPPWFTTWIGRKRRVLMIKQLNQPSYKESQQINCL